MAMFTMIVPLLVIVPILGGIAGIVLFVVGLVKKKPAMWGSGIGLAAVSLLVLVVGVVAVGMFAWRTTRRAAQRTATLAAAGRQTAAVAVDSRTFRTCTGLDLPAGTFVVGAIEAIGATEPAHAPDASQSCHFLKLDVQPTFDDFLRQHFEKREWKDVEKTLTGEPTATVGLWAPADLRNKTYYTRTYRTRPSAPDRMVTTIAHDPNAGVACVVSVQERDE